MSSKEKNLRSLVRVIITYAHIALREASTSCLNPVWTGPHVPMTGIGTWTISRLIESLRIALKCLNLPGKRAEDTLIGVIPNLSILQNLSILVDQLVHV